MNQLKENIKKYFIVKYAQSQLKNKSKHLSKSISWINRKSISNTIETHCKILLNSIINQDTKQSFRQNKFIIDSILKYTLEKSENILKSNKKQKDLKSYMQLNSFIVYDEIIKGYSLHQNKKIIKYNIEKQLSQVQEKIDSKTSIDKILQETINK